MSGDATHQIFLSHASEDKVAVRVLNERLKADGYATWLDEESILPGQDWAEEIAAAVRDSDIMLVCLSPASTLKTGYVHREIELALDVAQSRPKGTIFVIPVRLQPCKIPEQLDKWQWVDLSDNGYERLLFALNQHLLRQKPVRERFLAAMTNRIGFCSEALNWAKERQKYASPIGSTVELTEQLVSRAKACPREMKGASELLYAELGECLSKLTGLIDDSFLEQQARLNEEIDKEARMIECLSYDVKTIRKER